MLLQLISGEHEVLAQTKTEDQFPKSITIPGFLTAMSNNGEIQSSLVQLIFNSPGSWVFIIVSDPIVVTLRFSFYAVLDLVAVLQHVWLRQ